MSLSGTLSVLRRRWMPLILGLVVVTIGLAVTAKVAKPQYRAGMSILMSEPEPNPYSSAAGDKAIFTRLVGAVVSDAQTAKALYARGATAPYAVAPSSTVPSSLTVFATSDEPELSAITVAAVISEIGSSVSILQSKLGIPAPYRIVARPLDAISVQPDTKNQVRLLVLVAAGGLAIVFLGVFGIEAMSRREDHVGFASSLAKVLRRRVRLVGVVLASVAVGVLFVNRAPHEYQASEVMILLPPHLPPRPNAGPIEAAQVNPFLSYDKSFDVTAQLATIRVTGPDWEKRLAGSGRRGHYSVVNWVAGDNPVDTTAAPTPYVSIAATAADPDTAMLTVREVGAAFSAELAALQGASNAPRITWMTSYTAVPAQVEQLPLSKARALGVVGALAVCFGLLVVWAGRTVRRVIARGSR